MEPTDSKKDCLLIAYVRFMDGEDLREDLLLCKCVTTRATADEFFNIIDTYSTEVGLKCEDCYFRFKCFRFIVKTSWQLVHCPAVSWQTPPIPGIKKVFAEAFWNRSVQCSTKELTDKWLEATSHSAQFFFFFFGCSCSFITTFTYVTQVTHITTLSLGTHSVFLNKRPVLV